MVFVVVVKTGSKKLTQTSRSCERGQSGELLPSVQITQRYIC